MAFTKATPEQVILWIQLGQALVVAGTHTISEFKHIVRVAHGTLSADEITSELEFVILQSKVLAEAARKDAGEKV